ncbi:MAG TPA: tRNA preQ1(34) S-adenosylmethionine ribosyltransferase-isomerase QueA [Chloroflexi bacterium]|nr:tRNA preQ1(34) S-adenosylmethionine ribosyltransferase-isomerase QueA [Chloroflexota bacterium]
MKIEDFDYEIPPHLIAQHPLEPRDASRLMVISRAEGKIEDRRFRDIADYLRSGDLIVANDSRVIPARLLGHKVPTGGKVELLLTARRGDRLWEGLVRGRKVRVGSEVEFGVPPSSVRAKVLEVTERGRLFEFDSPVDLCQLGEIPLPPYIHEPLKDGERYQTVYARQEGSVAAPTAGLHFTPQLMEKIRAKGVQFLFVTLHIGPGTFRPVRSEEVEEHALEAEYGELSSSVAEVLNRAREEKRRVIAVGTTAVRVLETAYREGQITPYKGWTDLYIYPGYRFQVVEALITNFHLPRSTLLLLVAAFAGKRLIDEAYQEAIKRGYRFYSFGDAMFIV